MKKSKLVSLRLNAQEQEMLASLLERSADGSGAVGCNASEFFRIMLWREFNKRAVGTSKAPSSAFSDMRVGRPRANCHTVSAQPGTGTCAA